MLSSSKIRIGITLRVVKANNYDEKRDALSQEWTSFLEKLDAYPIFIPNTLTNVESFLKSMRLDGMILSGGDNIGDNSERDRTEKAIIEYGINSKIPIFGVCRGMQVLNKYFGGSIITKKDVSVIKKSLIDFTKMFILFRCHSSQSSESGLPAIPLNKFILTTS